MSNKPLLSIGMIVKNEIRCLERCLKALQPLRDAIPCELVIADTGSTDGTRELAEQYADILFDFEWIKDFAAARNAVMDRCSGEWYLSVDADEYLDNYQELAAFMQTDEKAQFTSAYLYINNYMSAEDETQYQMFQAHRLLNLATGLRYVGSIHEHWREDTCARPIHLEKTIFWHDGYVKSGTLAEEAKGKRNMELLENELAKDPHNLLLLVQAMQSAYTREQAIYYARRTMDDIKSGTPCLPTLAGVLYRDLVRISYDHGLPEKDEWRVEAEEKVPKSLYTMMDISYLVLSDALKKGDCETTLKYCGRYFAGLKIFNDNAYGTELHTGPLLSSGMKYQEMVRISAAMAHCKLRQWEEFSCYFNKINPLSLTKSCIVPWLTVAFISWEHLDLPQICQSVSEVWNDVCSDEKKSDVRKEFLQKACSLFMYVKPTDTEKDGYFPEQAPLPLIATMENCDLGRAAKVMLAENEAEISEIINGIKDWVNGIPTAVYGRLIEKNICLPRHFFSQSIEILEQIAGDVGKTLSQSLSVMLSWDGTSGLEHTPAVQLWKYLWTVAALRGADWVNTDHELLDKLVARFELVAHDFLYTCFQPVLLCEDNLAVLPSMHRFAWHFLAAMECTANDDTLQFVQHLRKGLYHAPVMKDMVNYLIEHHKQKRVVASVSPELRELAEKVRAILATYPADDPAVVALKQTPAYQQVAFLIEEK